MGGVIEWEARSHTQDMPGSPGEEGRIEEKWDFRRDLIPST